VSANHGVSTAQSTVSPSRPIRDLTDEEIAAFDRDGVVLARGVIPDDWVEHTARAIDDAAQNPTPFGVRLSGKGLHSDLFMWKYSKLFHDFVFHSPAAWLAQQVMRSTRVNFHVDHMFKKDVGCPVPTVWHRDEPAWPVRGSQAVNVWIPCDKVGPENSALQFIAGSHTWSLPPKLEEARGPRDPRVEAMLAELNWKPVPEPEIPADADPTSIPDVMTIAFRGVHRQLEQDMALTPLADDLCGLAAIEPHRAELRIVSWNVEPGDALLFGFRTLHFSTGVPDDGKVRRALGTRWTGDDAVYYPTVGNIPIFWRHDLKPGRPFGGSLFPQILPSNGAGAPRWQGIDEARPEIGFADVSGRIRALRAMVAEYTARELAERPPTRDD
jgi:ectoine hydroxylase-related dioxygenase (phytanoyl-CoA dioxygenase family)